METDKSSFPVSGAFVIFLVVFALATSQVWAQTTVNANWTDSTGNWTTPSNWSCNCVPNNSPANVFNVTMPGRDVDISLDSTSSPSNITIDTLSGDGAYVQNLHIEDGASLIVAGDMTDTFALDVDGSGLGGSTLHVGGDLTINDSNLFVGNSSMTSASMVRTAGNFSVTGAGGLWMLGGKVAGAQAFLNVGGAAPNTLTGSFYLQGDTGGAAVEYGSGEITQIGPTQGCCLGYGVVRLSGPNAFMELSSATGSSSALAGLKMVASNGELELEDGAALTTTGPLTINGSVLLQGTATGPLTLLNVHGPAPGTLTGLYDVENNAAVEFGSGGITQIGPDAVLYLGPNGYVELNGATGSNSALTGMKTVSGTLMLSDGAMLSTAGALSLTKVSDQGSAVYLSDRGLLHVGGNLTSSDLVFIIETGSTVTVAGTFTNTGALSMSGGNVAGSQALLDVNGAAPSTLTGNFDLQGNEGGAAVEYGSGRISQIGEGSVTFDGPNGYIELSDATGSNSALSGLRTISSKGELNLENGASFTTTGALTNNGTVSVAGGSSLTVNGGGAYAQASGSTDVNGKLMAAGGVKVAGGTLSGSGTVDSSVVNAGIVSPGDPSAPAPNATLTIDGNYTQNSDGTLVIDISSATDFGILDVTGKASLGGTADFDFLYFPSTNTDFAFLQVGSVMGDFAGVEITGINCRTCKFNLSTLTLDTGSSAASAVPEPGTLMLFATGLLGLAWLVRRKPWSVISW